MFTCLGLPMNNYITKLFRSSFRKPKRFRSLCRLRIPVNIVLKDISYDQIFLQRSTQNFEIRRRVPILIKEKTEKIQKEHTHTHISLSPCQSADAMLTLTCLHQSPSLSICKHGLDPDQTRMVFRIECFVNLKMCACDRKYTKP